MAIVVVGHLAPATSDAPLLLARAFRRLGWPADVFAMDEDLPSRERVLEPMGLPHDHPLWARYFNRRLLRHVRRTRPAALLLFGSNWKVMPETLKAARRLGVATAIWECNHWLTKSFQREALRHYDCYFDLDSHFLSVAREAGAGRVEQLPGCADPEEHHPALLAAAEETRYGADVSFVGSPYPERLPFFERLGEFRLKLWGTGWDEVVGRRALFTPESVAREPVYGLKKTKIYRASAINLNVQGNRMINGENFRLFEIASCESFCLTTPKPDHARWFQAGVDLETFTDADNLQRQVGRFLRDPDLRRERARQARSTVLKNHTYRHRAAQILEALRLPTAGVAA